MNIMVGNLHEAGRESRLCGHQAQLEKYIPTGDDVEVGVEGWGLRLRLEILDGSPANPPDFYSSGLGVAHQSPCLFPNVVVFQLAILLLLAISPGLF